MKESVLLTVASLLSILFGTFHLADDVNRGMSPGGFINLFGVVIFVILLYAALVLAGRRSGYVIILLASLLLMVIPVIHMRDESAIHFLGAIAQRYLFSKKIFILLLQFDEHFYIDTYAILLLVRKQFLAKVQRKR